MLSIAFIVHFAEFHYSKYDELMEVTHSIVDAFQSYDEAIQYAWENFNGHEVTPGEGYAYITADVTKDDGSGRTYRIEELNAPSYYTGPSIWF